MNNKILFFLLLISVSLSSFPQGSKKWVHSYTHQYLGIRNGLTQSQALLSFQDSYGYLWFSTYDGISRFDGLNFDNFNQDELQIANTRVRYFNQYEQAVYMVSGINIVFVYPDRSMEYYPLPDSSLLLSIDYLAEVTVVGDQLYLFNCQSPAQGNLESYSLIRFDLKDKTFTQIAENLPYLRTNIFEQQVYAITCREIHNRQLTLYKIDGNQLQTIQTVPMEEQDIYVDFRKTNPNEWVAILSKRLESNRTKHLYRCLIENDQIQWIPLGSFSVDNWGDFRLARWDSNRLLIGTNTSGCPAFVLDTDKQSLSVMPLNMITINHILVDRDGNLWFSTEEGVYQCARVFFESFQLDLGRNDNIWGVIRDSHGNIWFSSYTYGFWRVDPQGNLFPVRTLHNHKEFQIEFGYMGKCEDGRGRVYLTHKDGIAIFDPKQGYPNQLDIITTGFAFAIYHDSENGKTYFGGDSGVFRTLNVLDENAELSSYPSAFQYIVSICRDGNRQLRLGTYRGEARFDEENLVVVIDTVQHPYESLISMDLDEKGILWKGTNKGVFAEDRQGINRQISDGLVKFVLHYKNQYIIWGHKDKLFLLDLPAYHRDETIHIRSFGYYDGFDVLECGQNGASIDPEGYVWLAGGDKAIRFLPDQLMKIPPLQPVAPCLAAIYNTDKNSEWSLVQIYHSMTFENKDNFLRFDLLQASVSDPDRLVFRYRLNGYNEQWTTSRERSMVFQNLPFGKFRLELQSSVDDGQQWSESEFSPLITIRPPFLLTLPGLLLIFTGIALLTGLMVYYTRKISIRKEEELRQIDQLKHRAVQAKFIPHFIGNVLNSINYLIAKNPESARKFIAKFSDFTNRTLLNSSVLLRTVQEELDYTRLYLELEKLRFEEKLDYAFSIAPQVDLTQKIPTMVLQTFCENAIKHGLRPKSEGGKITIHVYPETDFVVIAVEDNGIGRDMAKASNTGGTKEGLKIVQQQLDICNKNNSPKAYLNIVDLFDNNNNPAGTRFELCIPKSVIL